MSSTTTHPGVAPAASSAPTTPTAANLNELVEFGVPFMVAYSRTGEPRLLVTPSMNDPESVTITEGTLEVLIDGRVPIFGPWIPMDGYSNQHGYSGPVMHPSEQLSGRMAEDVLNNEEPAIYLLMTVSGVRAGEEPDLDDAPAGWILLRHRSSSPSVTRLGRAVHQLMAEQSGLEPEIARQITTGLAYAWGRLDQGHPPFVAFATGEKPNTVDTAWGFATLYARMHQEAIDQTHPRRITYGTQDAWEQFAETGWIDGVLDA